MVQLKGNQIVGNADLGPRDGRWQPGNRVLLGGFLFAPGPGVFPTVPGVTTGQQTSSKFQNSPSTVLRSVDP